MKHPLRIIVFGLSLSSSWGNGHATTYRALLAALAARGHDILFMEREASWYAEHRDLANPTFCKLVFYNSLDQISVYRPDIEAADIVIIGSYVPDAIALATLIRPWSRRLAFYDIDTPITLTRLKSGDAGYIDAESIQLYDLYLSFTAGPALRLLEQRHGAKVARALLCAVDPALYHPMTIPSAPSWLLGYLGTYSSDRQLSLEALLLEPARRLPGQRFVVAGPQYPADIIWPANVDRIEHVPPAEHAAFYNKLCWTLNITRADMMAIGHSPSVRLFEAAACGTPIISDEWPGLEDVLTPGKEIMTATSSEQILNVLAMEKHARLAIGHAGRARILDAHTAAHRAGTLETYIAELAEGRSRMVAA